MPEEIRSDAQEHEEKVEKIDLGASLRKEHKKKGPVNRKVTVLVAALVIVAIAALAIVLPKVLTPKQTEEPVVDLSVNIVQHEAEDVVKLRVESADNDFTITRKNVNGEATYYIDVLENDMVNQGTCSSAFIQAATLTADQLVEENAVDMAQYGLDQPTSVLSVEYDDGSAVVLELGGTLDVTGQVYARVRGENKVYALRKYLHQIYGGSIARYRDLTLPTLSSEFNQVKSIIVRCKGKAQMRFMPHEDSATITTTWKMREPEELSLDAGKVSELSSAIGSVQLYDYQGNFENLAQFGLDEPWIELIASDTVGGKRVFRFGDTAPEGDRVYCTIDDSGDVFTVYNTYVEPFVDFDVVSYLDMFTNIIAIGYVDEMEVTDGKTVYHTTIERQEQYEEDGSVKMLANGKPDYLETFSVNGKEVQEKAFKTAYQAIIGVTISNVADEALVDETQATVVSVTYTLNNGQEPIQVEYLPYDINNYCVRRDGEIKLICKRELVDKIMPTMQSLVNGELDEAK